MPRCSPPRRVSRGRGTVPLAALCVALGAAVPASAASHGVRPRIVNGITSAGFPATAALLVTDIAGQPDTLATECTATVIGCRTALTAAHCVCPNDAATARQCRGREADPADFAVFLQHGGVFGVTAVAVDPTYHFGVRGDLALLTLDAAVDGIAPSPINMTGALPFGTLVTIVGFGVTTDDSNDTGLLRAGKALTARCTEGVPDATNICWAFANPLGPAGDDSNTCSGDSGGPLFVDVGDGPVLAGVTSGGFPTCAPNSFSWDTDVFSERDWIVQTAGTDIGTQWCGTLPNVGGTGTRVESFTGTLTPQHPRGRASFVVPAGTRMLRVALTGDEEDPSGVSTAFNDFDLYVRAEAPPTTSEFDCRDLTLATFGFCEIDNPPPGAWYAVAQRFAGRGGYQLTVTTFAEAEACVGDCDDDGSVTVVELIRGVNIALGTLLIDACPSFDTNGDGEVTVNELVTGVHAALTGCPAG